MQECPEIVHSFEEFNGANPFEPIKLCGAITDPSAYNQEKHGILSAVVRYNTPYILSTDEPFILAFGRHERQQHFRPSWDTRSLLGVTLFSRCISRS